MTRSNQNKKILTKLTRLLHLVRSVVVAALVLCDNGHGSGARGIHSAVVPKVVSGALGVGLYVPMAADLVRVWDSIPSITLGALATSMVVSEVVAVLCSTARGEERGKV